MWPPIQAICKGNEGKEWEAWDDHYRELHQATGTEKPGDSQKAKARWTMKAAKDRDDDFFTIQLVRTTFKAEPEPDWNCGKNTFKVWWQR